MTSRTTTAAARYGDLLLVLGLFVLAAAGLAGLGVYILASGQADQAQPRLGSLAVPKPEPDAPADGNRKYLGSGPGQPQCPQINAANLLAQIQERNAIAYLPVHEGDARKMMGLIAYSVARQGGHTTYNAKPSSFIPIHRIDVNAPVDWLDAFDRLGAYPSRADAERAPVNDQYIDWARQAAQTPAADPASCPELRPARIVLKERQVGYASDQYARNGAFALIAVSFLVLGSGIWFTITDAAKR